MPNHIHLILWIYDSFMAQDTGQAQAETGQAREAAGQVQAVAGQASLSPTVGNVVGGLKSGVSPCPVRQKIRRKPRRTNKHD